MCWIEREVSLQKETNICSFSTFSHYPIDCRGASNPSVGLQTCSHNSEWMKLRRLWSTDWDAAPVALGSFLFSPCAAGGRECSRCCLVAVTRSAARRRFLHIGWSERFHCRTYGLCWPTQAKGGRRQHVVGRLPHIARVEAASGEHMPLISCS